MFNKIKDWFKRWWKYLVGGLAAVFSAVFLWRRRKVGQLKDELAAERAKSEIQVLKAYRARMLEEGVAKDEDIERLDREIQKNKRAIVEAHENAEGLSDDEVETEFARLGY